VVVNLESSEPSIKLIYENIRSFRLRTDEGYYYCRYYYNSYGDICIQIDDLEFALGKSFGYDIEF
jgi:hypothetical protein